MFLLVRTKDRLRASMVAFKDQSFTTEALPISTIDYQQVKLGDDDAVDGFIVTSPQSVLTIPKTRLPLFCVGQKTADEALEMGHRVIAVGTGGAEDLAQQILKKFPTQHLMHVCGDTADTAWHELLTSKGYEISIRRGYTTKFLESLSQDTVNKINAGNYKALVFYSAQGAKSFVDLAVKFGVNLSNAKAVAMSEAVEVQLKGFGQVAVAQRPSEMEVIEAAKQFA